MGEPLPAVRGGILPVAGSRASASALSSSSAVLLRILAMFRAAKVSKSSCWMASPWYLEMVVRPCLELSSTLPATSSVVWGLGGVQGGLPLDSQGKGGLLGRWRSRESCRWITRAGELSAIWSGTTALSAGSSGAIFSLAVAKVFFLAALACLAATVSDSDEELDSWVEKPDSLAATLGPLLEELNSPGQLGSRSTHHASS